MLLQSTH